MLLVDVNVLLYAFDARAPNHGRCITWLEEAGSASEQVAVSSQTTAAVVRIATHPDMAHPAPTADVVDFLEDLRNLPAFTEVEPGPGHWPIFSKLVLQHGLKRGDVTDGWLAALALDLDAKLITTDAGFARFRGLRTLNPTRRG